MTGRFAFWCCRFLLFYFFQDYVVFHKQLSDLYPNQVDWFCDDKVIQQNRTEQNALLCCEPVFLIRRRLPQYFTGSITTCFGWEIIRILQIINKMAVSWSQSVKGSSGMNGGRSTPDIGLYGFCVCHLCVIWPPIQWSLSIVTVAVNSSVPEA